MPKNKSVVKNQKLFWLIVAVMTLALAVALGGYYLYVKRKLHGDLKGISVNRARYPIRGIDVSHYTGKIDFQKIREHGIRFVYLRATYGEHRIDKRFDRNFRNARENNLPVGAYHYLRFEQNGLQQARHFIRQLQGKTFDLPPALDVEDWGNSFLHNRKHVVEQIRMFIEEVERKTGRKVMIYTNENGYRKYIENNFGNRPIWICSFNNPPRISGSWIFWQHSHIGKMDGADGWVDYNVFYGDENEWKKFLRK